MVNMKCEDDEKETMAAMPEGPEYPYGLRICLNEESIKKLGIDKLPELGAEMILNAKVSVCSVSKSESEGGVYRNLDLQITDMELGSKKSSSDLAKKLYGG
jgi:hypothetical protein